MRWILTLLLALAPLSASAFSYATGGCATGGCAAGEQWEYTNANELDTALDAVEAVNTSQASTLSSLGVTYLDTTGDTLTGTLDITSGAVITVSSGGSIIVGPGATLGPVSTGIIRATAMSASGQIDDNDLAAGAVDLDTTEVSGTLPITNGGTGATALTNLITLSTHTTGNYVATIADSGASEVTVGGSGSEGAAVTLAIASTITRDSELAAISAASSTDTAVAKFSGTSGDIQNSGVTIDSSNNVVTPGSLTAGGSTGASTFTMRNSVDGGWVECGVVTTTMTCAVDADGTPDGTL